MMPVDVPFDEVLEYEFAFFGPIFFENTLWFPVVKPDHHNVIFLSEDGTDACTPMHFTCDSESEKNYELMQICLERGVNITNPWTWLNAERNNRIEFYRDMVRRREEGETVEQRELFFYTDSYGRSYPKWKIRVKKPYKTFMS